MAPHSTQDDSAPAAGAEEKHSFAAAPASRHLERMQCAEAKSGVLCVALSDIWIGIAAHWTEDGSLNIGFACNDGTYSIDFAVHTLHVRPSHVDGLSNGSCPADLPASPEDQATSIADYLVCTIMDYRQKNHYKVLGAGIGQELAKLSPQAAARLWTDLDIVPVVIEGATGQHQGSELGIRMDIDELADSLARKCLSFFGPAGQPRLQVGLNGMVDVDLGGRTHLTVLEQYRQSVTPQTWSAVIKYAERLRQSGKKFAFFSATPQGGGVALMRHALVRFFRLSGVDCTWWVPKPKPEIFRITKTNHNILQGVQNPGDRLSKEGQESIKRWISSSADRLWTQPGGPLSPRSQGGVDVVIADDPQMPDIVDISKRMDPDRPVIFRSHIQIRSDLASESDSPTAEVWNWLWESVQHADLFISHPVSDFVPHTVDKRALAYMPATTDWLDGLNKELNDLDTAYYIHEFNTQCQRQHMATLEYPKRDYIVQVARFDPSKGIPHVLASYAEFRRNSRFCRDKRAEETPQLVICGHSSVDDPDGVMVLNETLSSLENEYSDIKDSVVIMRLGGNDQLLNVLLSNARVALQLSTREGFEVKVSEALHKGVPIIATTAGGIPLQVKHGKSGFLVETGDAVGVAKHLDTLFSDKDTYAAMSKHAAAHVSDEVGTVGNAVCWMYLADMMSRDGQKVEPNGRWIWDFAREEAGETKDDKKEDWLPRDRTT